MAIDDRFQLAKKIISAVIMWMTGNWQEIVGFQVLFFFKFQTREREWKKERKKRGEGEEKREREQNLDQKVAWRRNNSIAFHLQTQYSS